MKPKTILHTQNQNTGAISSGLLLNWTWIYTSPQAVAFPRAPTLELGFKWRPLWTPWRVATAGDLQNARTPHGHARYTCRPPLLAFLIYWVSTIASLRCWETNQVGLTEFWFLNPQWLSKIVLYSKYTKQKALILLGAICIFYSKQPPFFQFAWILDHDGQLNLIEHHHISVRSE